MTDIIWSLHPVAHLQIDYCSSLKVYLDPQNITPVMSETLRGLGMANGRQFVVVTSVFLVLVYVVAGMRLWAKATIGRQFLAHDYLAFAALVCLTGSAVDSILCTIMLPYQVFNTKPIMDRGVSSEIYRFLTI